MFRQSTLNEDGSVTIPRSLVERWKRQCEMAYKDLQENEKNSDRYETDRMIAIFPKIKSESNGDVKGKKECLECDRDNPKG
ncbi:MAG: hypothetical protein H8D45_20945 [Bacteroidetes bacterium]|nr:hypothetical protein [Bacteroidota bacterium]